MNSKKYKITTPQAIELLFLVGGWMVGFSQKHNMFHCTINNEVTRWSTSFENAVMKAVEAWRELEKATND